MKEIIRDSKKFRKPAVSQEGLQRRGKLHLKRTRLQILLCTYLHLLLAAFQMAKESNTHLGAVLNATGAAYSTCGNWAALPFLQQNISSCGQTSLWFTLFFVTCFEILRWKMLLIQCYLQWNLQLFMERKHSSTNHFPL